MSVFIYGLYDPITKELRYVGKTNNLTKRLWDHIRAAKLGQKTYKATWIRKLLRENKRPIISIIQETTDDDWQQDEVECIAHATENGANLTNLTRGGDGLVGYKCSDETKEKIRQYHLDSGTIPPNWKGRKQSPEHIAKRIEARKRKGNYGHTTETKEKISKNRTGKALGNTNTLGYRHTHEWKQEASETRSGVGNPFYGHQHSDETKRKISETKRKPAKSRGDE